MNKAFIAWLELENQILKARRPLETAFIAVNLTHSMIPYRQAALWNRQSGVLALSGVATVESGTPYILWLSRVLRHFAEHITVPTRVEASSLPSPLSEQWHEWLPASATIVPASEELLFFARNEPFTDEEITLLTRLADLVALSRRALQKKRTILSRYFSQRFFWLAAFTVVCISMIPVTGSVLAPAEAVPANPTLVRAPLDGVIESIHIRPNETVTAGQALFDLDATTLSGRLDISGRQLDTAKAEYRQAVQGMVFDEKAKTSVTILAGKVQEKEAEVRLLEKQLARIQVKAPRPGIAVFDEISDWIGRPVSVGEKIMVVADAVDTEVEAWVSVANVGDVRKGCELTMFLNIAPLSPVTATVRSVAYEPSALPEGTLAHRVRATLENGQARPRLGLRGTARIDGDTVPLIWWLFRRPVSVIRQFIGI